MEYLNSLGSYQVPIEEFYKPKCLSAINHKEVFFLLSVGKLDVKI